MHQVATLSEIPHDRPLKVRLGDTDIILVRDGEAVRAYGATCPHAGAPLEQGAVCNGRIVCPWHKGMFAVTDGALLEPPPLDALPRYEARLDGEAVLVAAEPMARPPLASATDDRTFLIVGAGAAGTAAAAALREFGFGGRVVLLGAEPDAPYDRTALSKFVLEGGMKPDEVAPLRPAEFYADQRIERRQGVATRLDPAARRVTLADGGVIAYDAALLCPGGAPNTLDIPGAELAGVHLLRSLADARAILPRVQENARAVIIGGGFIGLEAASALSKHGLAVTAVTPGEMPFAKQFGLEVARSLRRLHEANGVAFVTGQAVAIEGEDRVTGVALESGRVLGAELVLVAIGVHPATGFAAGLAREADGSLAVDGGMRVAVGLYAAGDIATFPFGDGTTRVEHWRVAQQQARVAARNMLGGEARFEAAPFYWTYHHSNRIELLGHPSSFDEVVVDGDADAMKFVARQMREGQVVGVVACQREAETAALAATFPARP